MLFVGGRQLFRLAEEMVLIFVAVGTALLRRFISGSGTGDGDLDRMGILEGEGPLLLLGAIAASMAIWSFSLEC